MKLNLLFALSLFPVMASFSQGKKDVEYFDRDWQPIKNKMGAAYYRTFEKQAAKYIVRDFFSSNDQVQMIAECASIKPKLVMDGKVVWYYKDGTLETEGTFDNGERVGHWKSYYDDGSIEEEIVYRDSKAFYWQYWLRDGQPLLQNGNGRLVDEKPEKGFISVTEFVDSLKVAIYSVSLPEKDTVYLVAQQTAEYKGGFPAMYEPGLFNRI